MVTHLLSTVHCKQATGWLSPTIPTSCWLTVHTVQVWPLAVGAKYCLHLVHLQSVE